MSSNQDPVRLIAERVARRIASKPAQMPAPVESRVPPQQGVPSRARMIDFVSSNPPGATRPSITTAPTEARTVTSQPTSYAPPTQSPWLAPFAGMYGEGSQQTFGGQSVNSNLPIASHPSQERFGVEEATVSELVEFFENEKQCSVDPSGKPCDHCAMCSSRGF